MQMNRSFGLDLARTGAVGLVVFSHFVKKLEFVGFFGVELFFALSGYLIGGILYRELMASPRWSFSDVRIFWLRRWYRTLPNYLLFFLVALAYHAYFGGLPATRLELAAYLVFLQNFTSGLNSFYGVSWSLAVEEWFYLSFPMLILACIALRMNRRTAFIVATAVFLVLPPIAREFALTTAPASQVRLMTLPRLDAIFYGVLVAFITAHRPVGLMTRRTLMLLGTTVVAALLAMYAVADEGAKLTGVYRLTFVLAPASFALMLPWLKGLPSPSASWLRNPVTNLSLWSYSIYLSHIPVLFVVYELFGSSRDSQIVNLLSKAVGLVACLLLSRLVYLHFEKPLTALRPSDARKGVPRSIQPAP